MKKVLVAETIDQEGIDLLKSHFEVDARESTSVEELKKLIPNYNGLVIWTYARVPLEVIEKAV